MAHKWIFAFFAEDWDCTGFGPCVEVCGPRSLVMEKGIVVLAFRKRAKP